MKDRYLITGGAGFIGTNLTDYYLSRGKKVTIFDNFSRAGTDKNLAWLKERHGEKLKVVEGDIRDPASGLERLVEEAEVVFHQAAQVAVTTSVVNPRLDFETNALGTFNLLEAVRASSASPILVYSSTNKVYGKMSDVPITESDGRYSYEGLDGGVPDSRPLDFYSPYGCSKGAGDQYFIDYARIYGLRTITFRQSCIYGPHQFGVEDQGWVAWFSIRALMKMPVTIYGDGKQVRDVLYVGDLIDAYNAAIDNIEKTAGRAYNIGGGPANTLSLLELIEILANQFGYSLEYRFDDWRPGDQLVYVSDITRAGEEFGWKPRVSPEDGVERLIGWLKDNRSLFSRA